MNRRDLETLLLTLESTPVLLGRAARALSPAEVTRKSDAGGFSFIENVWHLADLEREAYAPRIRRLLAEEEPFLSNFDGDRVARERAYQRRDLAEGLRLFSDARHTNVEKLRTLSPSDWNRAGTQESVGRITLGDVPRMMAEHDRAHTQEIRDLLGFLRGGEASAPRQTSAVA